MDLTPAQATALLNLLADATRKAGPRQHKPARIDTLAALRRRGLVSWDGYLFNRTALVKLTDLGIKVALELV